MKKNFKRLSVLTSVSMIITILLSIMIGSSVVQAVGTYYVDAVNGNDSNSGDQLHPWKTIWKACSTITAGDTAIVLPGTYNETNSITFKNSGTSTAPIRLIASDPNNRPILNASSVPISTTSGTRSSVITIKNQNYITIDGLEICNYKTTTKNIMNIGIFVTGYAAGVNIMNCKIHDIQNNSAVSPRGTMGTRDAHGIGVYGTDPTTPISNIVIDKCEIYDCVLGSSETLVVNGNVDTFKITNNNIHNTDNIGIDVIGWEGKCPTASLDQARNGLVSGNTVHDICTEAVAINGVTKYNPCYSANDHSSDLIYVDGGKDTIIERNKCFNGDFGIEIASEHANKTTSGITVRNNIIYNNHQSGISIGGCEKDADGTHGYTVNSYFYNNTLYKNDNKNFYTGQVCLKQAHDNEFKNNIIYGTASSNDTLMVNAYMSATYTYNNTFDYNVWYSTLGTSATIFQWRSSSTQKNWANYKTGSGQDAHSQFIDPKFVNMTTYDFSLQSSSPAINKGTGTLTQYGSIDFYGNTRVLGGIVDVGALEKQ